MIEFGDFKRVDMRVGRIAAAAPLPGARKPAYQLTIDFGELGLRGSSAQITDLYAPAELIGRLVVAVVNFPPKLVAGFKSEVLVLGVDGDAGVVLLGVDDDVPPGAHVY